MSTLFILAKRFWWNHSTIIFHFTELVRQELSFRNLTKHPSQFILDQLESSNGFPTARVKAHSLLQSETCHCTQRPQRIPYRALFTGEGVRNPLTPGAVDLSEYGSLEYQFRCHRCFLKSAFLSFLEH